MPIWRYPALGTGRFTYFKQGFQKKTQATSGCDIETAKNRFTQINGRQEMKKLESYTSVLA
jgi:phage-related protein